MTNLDQFESVFKAAEKPTFSLERIEIGRAAVVTSLGEDETRQFESQVRQLLRSLPEYEQVEWKCINGTQFQDVQELLDHISAIQADLICTYRNLHTAAPDHPHSLGSYVDVLTQTTDTPVLLLPTPNKLAARDRPLDECRAVMAITDHLAGDHHLVSYASHLTHPDGTLYLSHVEDEAVFVRYMGIISKIPSIDTQEAREAIQSQLLKEPADFVRSVQAILREALPHLQVHEIVTMGHRMQEYQQMIAERQLDLMVMNTKDEDQLAMHGLAFPLAVELRDLPLLLL